MTTLLLLIALGSCSGVDPQAAATPDNPLAPRLRTLGHIEYLMLEPGAPQDNDVRELVVKALQAPYMQIAVTASLDLLNHEQQSHAARCLLSEQRGNRLTLECRDAVGRYVGTLESGPAPLNHSVSTTVWRLLEQLQQLKSQSGPAARSLASIKYLEVTAWPGDEANRKHFIDELRRVTPFAVIDDASPAGVDPAEVVRVTLENTGVSSGPMLTPSVLVRLLLTDSSGARLAQIGAWYRAGMSLSFRSSARRRIDAAVKALRQAYDVDTRIYAPNRDR